VRILIRFIHYVLISLNIHILKGKGGLILMFFTEEKANARINELSQYRYRDKMNLEKWSFVLDPEGEVGKYPQNNEEATVVEIGDRWQGRDLYAWLSTQVQIPQEWKEKEIVGLFDFGDTGGGTNSGFESLLFLNDKPF